MHDASISGTDISEEFNQAIDSTTDDDDESEIEQVIFKLMLLFGVSG